MKLPTKAKPSKAVSRGTFRPLLEAAHLRVEDNRAVLYATNSYTFLRLELDRTIGDEGVPPEGPIPAVALRHMEKGVNFTLDEKVVRAGITSYDRVLNEDGATSPGEFPEYAHLKPPKSERRFRLALNANLLHDLAQGMGSKSGALVIEIDLDKADTDHEGGLVWNRAMMVTSEDIQHQAEGLMMPVRLHPR